MNKLNRPQINEPLRFDRTELAIAIIGFFYSMDQRRFPHPTGENMVFRSWVEGIFHELTLIFPHIVFIGELDLVKIWETMEDRGQAGTVKIYMAELNKNPCPPVDREIRRMMFTLLISYARKATRLPLPETDYHV